MYDSDPRIGLGTCAGHGRVTTGPDNISGGHSPESRTFPTNSSHRRVLISPPYRPRGRSPTSIRLCAHANANDAHIGSFFRATLSSISDIIIFSSSLHPALSDMTEGGASTEERVHCPGLWATNLLAHPLGKSQADRLRCYPNRANHPNTHNRGFA